MCTRRGYWVHRCRTRVGPGVHLTVSDALAVAEELAERRVAFRGPYDFLDGVRVAGVAPPREPFNTFFDFADPDGNSWIIQEVPAEN